MSRRRIYKALAACLVLATLLSAFPAMAAGTEAADSVYRNGNIYTVDEAFSKATALAIKGDRLVYVGGEAGVEAYMVPIPRLSIWVERRSFQAWWRDICTWLAWAAV